MKEPFRQTLFEVKWHSVKCVKYKQISFLLERRVRSRRIYSLCLNSEVARSSCDDVHADVVIIGGGIVGLCASYSLLKQSSAKLKVAIIEANSAIPGPSIGNGSATGAGQGYIWMSHRNPDSPTWSLAEQSKALWQELFQADKTLPESSVQWQRSGSILLATCDTEMEQLHKRHAMLAAAGIDAAVFNAEELRAEEPALGSAVCAGLVTRSDAQMNGRLAATALLRACSACGDGSDFDLLLEHRVEGFESCQSTGRVLSVQTDKRRVIPHKALIIAAGAWTAALAAQVAPANSAGWLPCIQPRRGHLLELGPGMIPPIRHGLMEIGYAQHYTAQTATTRENLDITFTATTSASGNLLLGSSREFCGFEGRPSPAVMQAILDRAAIFLPGLSKVHLSEVDVRVGLRPYSPRGLPYVGWMPGNAGVLVAAGHEGSGLTYGPRTGEIIRKLILGEQIDEDDTEAFKLA